MSDASAKIGKALRFITSSGYAEIDPDVVNELLAAARRLATAVIDDPGTSNATKADAHEFLLEYAEDTYDPLAAPAPRAEAAENAP